MLSEGVYTHALRCGGGGVLRATLIKGPTASHVFSVPHFEMVVWAL